MGRDVRENPPTSRCDSNRSSRPNRYDLTAMEPAHIADTILSDWHHLLKDESIVESPSYLKHQGAIVLAIGGTFEPFDTRGHLIIHF